MSLEQAFAACFESRQENEFTYVIPVDFPAFKGHFVGNPLLPGVCQFGLCADALGRMLGKPMEIATITRSKFMAPIRPGQRVLLTLDSKTDGQIKAELKNPQDGSKFCQLIFSGRSL